MASKFNFVAANHGCPSPKSHVPPPKSHFPRVISSNDHFLYARSLKSMNTFTTQCYNNVIEEQDIVRRSANYQPTLWKYEYIQSIKSKYLESEYGEQAAKLKKDVKQILEKLDDPLDKLEIVDDLERLGISYHFEDEIRIILKNIYQKKNYKWNKEDLFATSLKFRLLRQHGYKCPQDVFKNFMDEMGQFKASLSKDAKGLLYLYEASYLSIKGEAILDKAREFSTKFLNESLKNQVLDPDIATLVGHALELPLRWRMPRLEARWYIDLYERRLNMNPIILEFAKLDFNMVQAIHQQDLKHASRWWKRTGLGEILNFARDRIVENFLWPFGMQFEPQFEQSRRVLARVLALITTIDDLYDVHGTLEELELFTNAVERWDITAIEELPDYMKICYLALFNSVNEMAYDALIGEGSLIISHLIQAWVNLCKLFLLEAKWYHTDYKPTFEEYLNVARRSVAGPLVLIHTYFLESNQIKNENLVLSEKYQDIVGWSSIITRVSNDLATSSIEMERGDNFKSIQCYINETGASEEDAREHLKYLIDETWKNINEFALEEDYPIILKDFTTVVMNFSRMAQCMYQNGDVYTSQDSFTKDLVNWLLINPVPL